MNNYIQYIDIGFIIILYLITQYLHSIEFNGEEIENKINKNLIHIIYIQ